MKKHSSIYDWSDVDWTFSTEDIARQVGCGKTTVCRARRRLAPHTVRPRGRKSFDWSKVDWKLSTCEIVKITGQMQPTVSHARRRHAPETVAPVGVLHRSKEWQGIDWDKERDDEMLAVLMRCKVSTVKERRRKLAPHTVASSARHRAHFGYWDD